MPSYLRRAACSAAWGAVSSYRSNHANWEANGKQGKEPNLALDRSMMPVFYNKEMYAPSDDANSAYLKLFYNNDWVWIKIQLRPTDVKYLQRYWSHIKASAPVLEKHYGKYYLRFAFEESVQLSKTPIKEQRICAIDLGLNSDAVCSIMCSDGTILARKFIDFPSDKDHLYTVLNRIKRFQREHGSKDARSFWKYAQRLNSELAKKIANAIVEFAVLYSVDCVVFEHLDFRGKKNKGSKAQRLSLWRRNGVQDYAEHAICNNKPVLCKIVPELAPLIGCQQNNRYHNTDVFGHTVQAMWRARNPWKLQNNEFPMVWTDSAVCMALFFHDFGKPAAKTTDEDGHDHFYGHPAISAGIAEKVMSRLRFSNYFKDMVVELVAHHDVEFMPNKRCVRRMLNKFGVNQLHRLLKIRECDNWAHSPAARPLFQERVIPFATLLEEVLEEQSAFSLKDLAINGRDLINVGVKPGPEIGRLLNMALDAVIDEKIENKKQPLLEFLLA